MVDPGNYTTRGDVNFAPGPGERRWTELNPRRSLNRRWIVSSGAKRTSPSQVGRHRAISNPAYSSNATLTAWLVTANVTLNEG